jgi:BirA family biotin operon repressor/biotin-[acetyl-CoA-carboxylase] ligase
MSRRENRSTLQWHNARMQFDVRRFESVTSTMDVCRALAEQGAAEGVVIVADKQTAGRGRAGRAWFSPPGQSLYVSILLRPQLAPRQISWLTMIGALAVLEMGNGKSGMENDSPLPIPHFPFAIKWFNDVLLNGKKLAGVLAETALTSDQLDYAILGIGLNVNTRFDDAPEEVRQQATSLRQSFGVEVDREAVLRALLDAFAVRYDALPVSPVADYSRHLDTLGKRVRLSVGDEIIEGQALRVEDDGALVVETDAGEHRVRFGDVLTETRPQTG